LGVLDLVLLLLLRQLHGSKPLIWKGGRDKVFVVVIGTEAVKNKEIGPGGRSFRWAGVDSLEEIIVHHMKLWTDVTILKVPNETNCAGM
jgi:hypothetical protein